MRQIASALAVFPPETKITSWASASSRRSAGGQGKNETCETRARSPNAEYAQSVFSALSPTAVGTNSTRGRSLPVKPST